MIAKIIKLDEYLEQARHNIMLATVDALRDLGHNVGVNEVKDIYMKASEGLSPAGLHDLEARLIDALDANDAESVATTLSYNPSSQIAEVFKDISIAEDYNFHRTLTNEVARNNIMDWLEDNSVKYLIDNDGNFAVQCQIERLITESTDSLSISLINGIEAQLGKMLIQRYPVKHWQILPRLDH